MNSRSKYLIEPDTIHRLFENAGIMDIQTIQPLGAGEFNSLYSVATLTKSYVIKIAPLGEGSILTYETQMMASEVYFYQELREKTSISVPEIYASDFTCKMIPTSYFIMEKLEGTTLDQAKLLPEEHRKATELNLEMIAMMHSIQGIQFGYLQNGLHDNWYQAILSMVENLLKDARRFHHGSRKGQRLLLYIIKNKTILETVESRMVNFDIWYPNIICDQSHGELSLGWIDLERCFWGDRIADFVSVDFMNMTLDKKINVLEIYNRFSKEPLSLTNNERIRFAIMLGYLGLIMEVEKYARYSLFHFGWWRNVAVCKMLYKASFESLKSLS